MTHPSHGDPTGKVPEPAIQWVWVDHWNYLNARSMQSYRRNPLMLSQLLDEEERLEDEYYAGLINKTNVRRAIERRRRGDWGGE